MWNRVFNRLENIKIKAEELYNAGIIKDITRRFFIRGYNSLSREIKSYKRHPELCEDWKLKSIISQIEEYNHILSVIEKRMDERKHKNFFSEILSRFEDFDDIDLWMVRIPFKIPRCRFLSNDGELCFILQIPEKPDYLDYNLLGLLAHEPAHIHHVIKSMVDSVKEMKRKTGESLADILAFSIVEYMFTHSSIYLVREVISISKASELKGSHPSWLARVTVLRSVTDEVWSDPVVVQRNLTAFDKLLTISPTLSATEEFLVRDILKEARRWMGEWIKYKTDENLLSKLENLSDDEAEKIGEIPKKIRELIIGCTN